MAAVAIRPFAPTEPRAQTNRKLEETMTTTEQAVSEGLFSFLDRSRTVAKPGFSRWMVPPAALCVHLCIGQAYAFSVFNLPMTKLVGISQSSPNDWNIPELGWIFSIAILVLGFSAAIFGRWVEEGGPRRAMFTAALCWAGGFIISAIGVYVHNLWIVYFG
jgi:Major Facilitator Superfamily